MFLLSVTEQTNSITAFGFAISDCITVIILTEVKSSYLQDTKGSKMEYQELLQGPECF